jgi:hypothetical protein
VRYDERRHSPEGSSAIAAHPSRRRCRIAPKGKGSGMSINTYRGFLYKLARILGDVNAVQKGKVGRRVARRAVGKLTGRGLGKLFR